MELRSAMLARRISGKWLRVDWVEAAEPLTWAMLRARLARTKRNYFRHGVALDREFKAAFLEQELNANAMLYGGNTVTHAVVNEKNFRIGTERKFGDLAVDFSDRAEIFAFSTRAVFCDAAGGVHMLDGVGPDAGRRHVGQLSSDDVLALVRSSSGFLARQVKKDGAFIYGYHPCFDRQIEAYNTLRHASTTYAMIEAFEVTQDTRLKAAIARSIAYLTKTLIRTVQLPDGTEAAFLVDVGDEIKLGGNAVAILALAKYCEVTGTRDFLPLLEKLALGICAMQDQTTGAFVHVLHFPALSVKEVFRTIYYEGEAAFGLMRLYNLTRDPRWLAVVEKGFEHFIANSHWKHHDHWLGYCVNELTRYRPEERYFRFGIMNVAGYLDFVLERITTFPTLLELMSAAREMLERIERMPELHHLLAEIDLEKFYRALEFRAHHLLNGYFWPEMAMYFQKPERIVGSFFIRHHAFRVRIDDVEHYLSGFVAYRKYLIARSNGAHEGERNGAAEAAAPRQAESDLSTTPKWLPAQIEEATKGVWLVAPPAGWSASGLCIHAPAMQAGNLVAARASGGTRGVPVRRIWNMQPPPAAIITAEPGLVRPPGIPILAVPDVDEAILSLGRSARARMTGKVLAITGSAGKTTAVAMLAGALSTFGPVGRSLQNANLPHGVAWNLASLAWDIPHVVLELAIGHMGQSARMARPDVAIFTNILPAHLGPDSTISDVARTKSAIFRGMSAGAVAILNRDMLEWRLVHEEARARNLRVVHYGTTQDCDFQLLNYDADEQRVSARVMGREIRYRVGAAGMHMALNSLAVLAAVSALGHPLEPVLANIETFAALPGRGEELRLTMNGRRLTIIDDAYNANPGSMKAALHRLSQTAGTARRIAVLGQMAELGPQAESYHRELAALVADSPIDRVYVTGGLYSGFWSLLPASRRGYYASSPDEMKPILQNELADGDVVLFKGSNSTCIHRLVAWMKENADGSTNHAKAPTRRADTDGKGPLRITPRPTGTSSLLYDVKEERVVFAERETELHPPASITKILTLCLIEERLQALGKSRGGSIPISASAANVDSWWGFSAGERIDVETLMKACAVVSSNEAANALAEWHSGSLSRFTDLLNGRAAEIGMCETYFSSPSGLGSEQKTTAIDVLTLARHVYTRHPAIAVLCAQQSFSWRGRTFANTNRLLGEIPGADGLKTGTLAGRGNHIVFSALQSGRRCIAIVLGAPTKASRDETVRELMGKWAAYHTPHKETAGA
ncbi:MAG: Mur ligase family protein [Shinella sp.]|nr:Mur ligase family protein [Shinella sp.]